MQILRRTRATVALAFAAAAIAACGSDSPTEPTVFGTYAIVTVNGHSLPYSKVETGVTVTLNSGSLVMKSDHTFIVTFNVTGTTGTITVPSTDTDNGTFSVSRNTVTFVSASDQSTTTGTLDGNTLTVNSEGDVLVFKK